MKYGITVFLDERGVPVTDLARAVEERGFESLFVTEHTHHPAGSVLPDGGEIPPELAEHFIHSPDPFVALTAAASVTTDIRLGTGICLLPQHDTIVAAKATSTLDWISGGRLIFGVGAGWNTLETANHGVDPQTRWARMTEQLHALRAIWTQPSATFEGAYVNFKGVQAYPKPIQDGGPELLIGGDSDGTRRRVLEVADGWMPTHDRSGPDLEPNIAALLASGRESRRPTSVTVSYVPPDPQVLERYAEIGVSRLVFAAPVNELQALLGVLQECESAIRAADLD